MNPTPRQSRVAVIGTGPAGLMAASIASRAGYHITLMDKKSGPGRKLLIAGSSGLNISNDSPIDEFIRAYRGPKGHFKRLFELFPREAWLKFIHDLGIETFLGTSHRYFVQGLKGAPLLRAWTQSLVRDGAEFRYKTECMNFELNNLGAFTLSLAGRDQTPLENQTFDAVCFALGGASYEPNEMPLRWPPMFEKKGLTFTPWRPSNVGFEIKAWSPELLVEAEGLPLKGVTLSMEGGASKRGDLIVTRYGLEGTPIYHIGKSGRAFLDLKPELTVGEILARIQVGKENLSPIRRIKKYLNLCDGSQALLFHLTPRPLLQKIDLPGLVTRLKRLPIELGSPRPLAEAISSAGGLRFQNLDDSLMLRSIPGVFVAGEMLDWDAPTGGHLIQACASQGYLAGSGMVKWLGNGRPES
ncbi:MAG: TIGR03862 family flavoprotein [Bdellovibrionota bacterium]